jgi:hypothetical protein
MIIIFFMICISVYRVLLSIYGVLFRYDYPIIEYCSVSVSDGMFIVAVNCYKGL